jgi:hypothetical protein
MALDLSTSYITRMGAVLDEPKGCFVVEVCVWPSLASGKHVSASS